MILHTLSQRARALFAAVRAYLRPGLRNRLLFNLTAGRPCKLINSRRGPYLERYYLGSLLGVRFQLHRFVSRDGEEHTHNHPWRWGFALLLCGAYIEERAVDTCPGAGPSGCLTRNVYRRWFNPVWGNTVHRVAQVAPGTWTLFVRGPDIEFNGQRKGWGFFKQLHAPELAAVPAVTIFRKYPEETGPDWWLSAPAGRDSGRLPLVERGHRWDDSGERCERCGDKDWMAGPKCDADRVAGQ